MSPSKASLLPALGDPRVREALRSYFAAAEAMHAAWKAEDNVAGASARDALNAAKKRVDAAAGPREAAHLRAKVSVEDLDAYEAELAKLTRKAPAPSRATTATSSPRTSSPAPPREAPATSADVARPNEDLDAIFAEKPKPIEGTSWLEGAPRAPEQDDEDLEHEEEDEMPRGVKVEIDEDELRRLRLEEHFGCAKDTVSRALNKLGIGGHLKKDDDAPTEKKEPKRKTAIAREAEASVALDEGDGQTHEVRAEPLVRVEPPHRGAEPFRLQATGDLEANAIAVTVEALARLEGDARERVWGYLSARFGA